MKTSVDHLSMLVPKFGLIFLKYKNIFRLIHLESSAKTSCILPLFLLIVVSYASDFFVTVFFVPLFPRIYFTSTVAHPSTLYIGMLLHRFLLTYFSDVDSLDVATFVGLHVKRLQLIQLICASNRAG